MIRITECLFRILDVNVSAGLCYILHQVYNPRIEEWIRNVKYKKIKLSE